MGAWFSSEADEGEPYVPNTPSTRAAAARRNARAVAPRVNNAGSNVEAASPAESPVGAAAPRLNNAGNNAEAPAPAANGAAAPRVNNTTRNAERGNRRNNSRRNNAVAPKLNEPSPAGQEEEGFAPNTVVNVKNQTGGRKRKSRKGKGRKGKSRKNRK
jgi:hypothetical protein